MRLSNCMWDCTRSKGSFIAFLILKIAAIVSVVTRSSDAMCTVSCPLCPCFTNAPYNISIAENLPIGHTITTLTADDPDSTDLEYSIHAMSTDAFNIDHHSGALTVATELDFESNPVYHFRVQASDEMRQRGLADITINLMNLNEYPPQCASSVVYYSTTEGLMRDTFYLPSCTDADQPDTPQISYRIVSGNDDANFAINQTNGSLSLARTLDYETQTLYQLEIAACDENGGSGSLNTTVTAVISVLPVNEFTPTFTSSQFMFTVSETADISTTIDRVTASDDDSGDDGMIVYSFGSNPPNVFTIDSLTGDIILTRSLDFEEVGSYRFTTVATDSSSVESERRSLSGTVVITVQDENDNHPMFSQSVYSARVREDALVNDQVTTISCSDLDSIDNVTYSISQGNIDSKFTIDAQTGTISLMNTLDFDDTSQAQHFEMIVQCTESSTPRVTVEALVIIEVTSYDEFYPDPGFEYTATVSESMASGSSILRVQGRDRDQGPGGLLHYSLNDNTPACPQNLHIDVLSGILYLLSPFDYEEPPYGSHTVMCTVTVSDSEHSAEADIILTLENVNDVRPVCDPSVYAVNVSENASIGEEVLSLSCSDADSPILQYTMLQNNANPFQISSTGVITVTEALDFETQQFYDITIEVSDDNYSINVTVHISVTGVNEHSPVFPTSTLECSVSEDSSIGSIVCTVTAADGDSGEDGIINYQIINSSSEALQMFLIDQTSGHIHLIRDLDYEIDRNYSLIVAANDRGTPSLSESILVYIQVIDVNDNPPQMDVQLFYSVPEDTPPNRAVSTISCIDADSGSNAQTNLQMSSLFLIYPNGTEQPARLWPFSINSTSGELTLTGVLDYKYVQSYRLSIICRDSGTPVHATFSTVTIQVLPINEHTPQFTESSYQLNVEELTAIGTSLMTFSASDEDGGIDGEIRYSISPGNNVPFAINQDSGVLTVYNSLDCSDSEVYNFTIEARDGGTPSLQTHALVTVNIVHCHLGELFALQSVYTANVSENAPTGTPILTVTCNSTRAFIPSLSPPSYQILSGSIDSFRIDSSSGEITVRNSPDFETHSSYMLQVQCSDPHNLNISAVLTVYIIIMPINEHAPVFNQSSYTVSINEGTIIGTRVAQIQATDADSGRDGELSYSIQDNAQAFTVNPLSGELYLSASLDRERINELTLNITAQDNPSGGTSGPLSSSTQVRIIVLDSNDNWPVCERTVYHLIVSPNAPVPRTILESLNCSDADLGANSLLEYSISDETFLNVFSVHRTLGQLTLESELDPSDSPIHHIPITVHDSGTPSFSISVLVVIEVQEPDFHSSEPGDDYHSLVEAEGLLNSVSITLHDFSKTLWEERNNAKNSFQDAIARSVTDYCALLPEACSLESGCAQFFGHSSSRRRRKRNDHHYISFSNVSIEVLPDITEVSSSSLEASAVEVSSETVSLQVRFYVVLPESASRSPYRETNYVVPRATLTKIIEQDERVIEAIVRDSVSPYLTVTRLTPVNGWLVSASVLLVISAILASVILIAGIAAVVYKYKQRQSKKIKIVPLNSNRITSPSTSHNRLTVTHQQQPPHPKTRSRSSSISRLDGLPNHLHFLRRNKSNTSNSTTCGIIRRDSETSPLSDDGLSDVSEISLDNEEASMENNASSKNSQLSESQGLSSGFSDSLNTDFVMRQASKRPEREFGDDFTDNFPFSSPRKPLQRVTIPKWSISYGSRPK